MSRMRRDGGTPEGTSKSEMKRRMTALQNLGKRLGELTAEAIRGLDLPEDLREELLHYKTLSKHEARRRQMQYIGKVMRDVDAEAIEEQLDALHAPGRAEAALHKRAEALRETLLAGGVAEVDALCAAHPGVDRQQLVQLVRSAGRERDAGKPPKAYRQLFRLVRGLLEEGEASGPEA